MATTKLWKISSNIGRVLDYACDENKTNLSAVIDYAINKDKTEQELYVSGINCSPETVYEEMNMTKKRFNKTKGILAFHGYQSFKENEVTPELAHEVGLKLANEMWGDKFEVLVSTHLNTNHIHNHFVVNSVSFIDGRKYNSCKASTAELRRINDLICEEYGLSVLEEKMTGKSKINFSRYQNEDRNHKLNYYQITKKEIDLAIKESTSFTDFENLLSKMGYEHYIRYGRLSVIRYDYKRNIRLEKQFGEEYTIDNIERRILETEPSNCVLEEEQLKKYYKIEPRKKYHSFIGLYRYYCYLLKVYPHNIRKYNLTYLMRNDIEILEQLNKETIFLVDNNINTKEELINIRNNLLVNKNQILINRDNTWKDYKKNPSINLEINIKEIKKELDDINNKLELTYSIERRVDNIKSNLEEYQEKNEKGVVSRESIK